METNARYNTIKPTEWCIRKIRIHSYSYVCHYCANAYVSMAYIAFISETTISFSVGDTKKIIVAHDVDAMGERSKYT